MTLNKKRQNRVSPHYDLSRNYQISENIIVTTRLVLPLDVCNVALYITYVSGMILLRSLRTQVYDHRFAALVELDSVLTLSQAPLSLLIGLRFINSAKRKTEIIEQPAETDLYFKQLSEHWQ
ncbi:hypothetical protein AAVH_30789 [Aphelenchoides avenae]|nr:hypothetical protein AAVH_30789 [Aphelenchus avenae]